MMKAYTCCTKQIWRNLTINKARNNYILLNDMYMCVLNEICSTLKKNYNGNNDNWMSLISITVERYSYTSHSESFCSIHWIEHKLVLISNQISNIKYCHHSSHWSLILPNWTQWPHIRNWTKIRRRISWLILSFLCEKVSNDRNISK